MATSVLTYGNSEIAVEIIFFISVFFIFLILFAIRMAILYAAHLEAAIICLGAICLQRKSLSVLSTAIFYSAPFRFCFISACHVSLTMSTLAVGDVFWNYFSASCTLSSSTVIRIIYIRWIRNALPSMTSLLLCQSSVCLFVRLSVPFFPFISSDMASCNRPLPPPVSVFISLHVRAYVVLSVIFFSGSLFSNKANQSRATRRTATSLPRRRLRWP